MTYVGLFYGRLVYFTAILVYGVTISYNLWSFGIFDTVLVCCIKKNLATLIRMSQHDKLLQSTKTLRSMISRTPYFYHNRIPPILKDNKELLSRTEAKHKNPKCRVTYWRKDKKGHSADRDIVGRNVIADIYRTDPA
jgi:hypothetical protein